jgi:hypothetical protein
MAIRPLYSRFDYPANRWEFDLTGEDFDKVQKGYACGECLEDYGGIWLPECPVCRTRTQVVVERPPEWSRG